MSHKASNRVWGSTLTRIDLIVALAIADICDDQGRGIYPSIEYAAWKTNLSERSVQRVIARFVKLGILEVVRGPGRSRPTEYRMLLDAVDLKGEWMSAAKRAKAAESQPGDASKRETDDRPEPVTTDQDGAGVPQIGTAGDLGLDVAGGKGDSESPITKRKGDSRGIKGDSRGIKGDRACHPNRTNRNNREREHPLSGLIFRCPPDFKISDELLAEASRGLALTKIEIANEIRKFRIYPFERKVPDWSAKFCVWMARADEHKGTPAEPARPPATEILARDPAGCPWDASELNTLDLDPPSETDTRSQFKQRIEAARTNLKQANMLARQVGIEALKSGETLKDLDHRIATRQMSDLAGDQAEAK